MNFTDEFTTAEIIARAGGPVAIGNVAHELDPNVDAQKMEWAARKWPSKGIPERHWDLVVALAGVTLEQIYRANKMVREASANAVEAAE